ncbi:meiotic expression protein 13, putative [Entamoeba invadens IP1]|uniref:meiotic expression protein 13, putative n=1 Tax=Entamoeba invadens IP1 TaxID=370355 RepID=UPI0002C3DCB2|nr:meiotic expression protein 13, putative [Entamoeba invadens IP1]ELP85387.1 meiotic expression protein 13, putative [Entamoeba invadens IP1]|eukprot:XP_004184733.1 meiotic expression protein 13, putative [Entamoeba invadens IP1]
MSKKIEEKSDDEALVLDYMIKQNKPFNAKTIFENLKKAVKMATLNKVLDGLVEQGKLREKANGKQKIYWYNQDLIEGVSAEALHDLDAKKAELVSQLKDAKDELEIAEKENKGLKTQMSNEDIQKQLKEVTDEVAVLEKKCENCKNAKPIDPKQKEKMMKEREEYLREWKKRKRITKEAAEAVLSGSAMKLSKFYEQLGIETDEANGLTPEMMTGKFEEKRPNPVGKGKKKK